MLGGNKQRGKGWKPPLRTVSEFMTGSSHGWDSRRVAGEGSRGQRGRHGPQTSGLEWAGVAEADWMVINTAGAKADQKDRPGAWISHKCNTQVLIESLLKVQFTLVFSTGHFFFFFFFFFLYIYIQLSPSQHTNDQLMVLEYLLKNVIWRPLKTPLSLNPILFAT